jgi:hypothetical protein
MGWSLRWQTDVIVKYHVDFTAYRAHAAAMFPPAAEKCPSSTNAGLPSTIGGLGDAVVSIEVVCNSDFATKIDATRDAETENKPRDHLFKDPG